jgi:hypothetical protein
MMDSWCFGAHHVTHCSSDGILHNLAVFSYWRRTATLYTTYVVDKKLSFMPVHLSVDIFFFIIGLRHRTHTCSNHLTALFEELGNLIYLRQ